MTEEKQSKALSAEAAGVDLDVNSFHIAPVNADSRDPPFSEETSFKSPSFFLFLLYFIF